MSRKSVINVDDLVYDGKNLIIPSNWVFTLAEFTHNGAGTMDEADVEDIQTFKKFLIDVVQHKQQSYGG